MAMEQYRIIIEGVSPSVDNGRFAAKAIAGETVNVSADIFKDGHEKLRAVVLFKPIKRAQPVSKTYCREAPALSDPAWRESPLTEGINDRWSGSIMYDSIGDWVFTICAWTDAFGSWRNELKKKAEALDDVSSELLEGSQIIERTLGSLKPGNADAGELRTFFKNICGNSEPAEKVAFSLDERLAMLMERHDPRQDATLYYLQMPLWVDREKARFGSWYEIFVRSQGTDPGRSATFKEAEKRLPYVASLGFDILYLPLGFMRHGPRQPTRRSLSVDKASTLPRLRSLPIA